MPNPSPSKWKFSFENDISGRFFCWLIESGRIDYPGLIEKALEKNAVREKVIKRLAKALEQAVGEMGDWTSPGRNQPSAEAIEPISPCKAPSYSIWFRPSPSKKIKFKEVAEALLVFTDKLPPDDSA